MESKTNQYWASVGKIRDNLIERAQREGEPVFSKATTARKPGNQIEVPGSGLIVWIKAIDNPANPTDHKGGQVSQVYAWEAARAIHAHDYVVASPEDVAAELDRQANHAEQIRQIERRRIAAKNAEVDRTAEMERQNALLRERIELEERARALKVKV